VSAIETAGGRVLGVQPVRRNLEEYFFEEMGGVPTGQGKDQVREWGEG
jgi:hypothetical protein